MNSKWSGDKAGFILEPARKTPIAGEVDVLVVGGGLAGVCAAVAAGTMGLKTLLVEYFGCLGGNATSGLVNCFCGFFTRPGLIQVVRGLGGRIIRTMMDRQAAQEKGWCLAFDPERLKMLLEEMAARANVELLYYTQAVDPILEDNVLKGVVIANKGGRQAILAKRVLDCTGDGDVCALAGVPFELGDGHGGFQAVDMAFHLVNVDETFDFESSRALIAQKASEAVNAGRLDARADSIIKTVMIPGAYWVNMASVPWNVSGVDPHHLTRAAIDGRKAARELAAFLRETIPGLGKARIVATAAKLGVRETRRVLGRHVLTGDEILAGKKFDDGIGANPWPIEFETIRERNFQFLKDDDFHTIPYRCLIPQNVENLLMAGRFVSATHEAQASIRVTGPASVMGQAIGTAAGLSIREGVESGDLDANLLRSELKKDGVFLG